MRGADMAMSWVSADRRPWFCGDLQGFGGGSLGSSVRNSCAISIEGLGLFFKTEARKTAGGGGARRHGGPPSRGPRWVACRDRSGPGRGDPPFVAARRLWSVTLLYACNCRVFGPVPPPLLRDESAVRMVVIGLGLRVRHNESLPEGIDLVCEHSSDTIRRSTFWIDGDRGSGRAADAFSNLRKDSLVKF